MSNGWGGRRANTGARPGNKSALRSGLKSPELAPLRYAAGVDGAVLIVETVRRTLRDALAPLRGGHSRAAIDARQAARSGTLASVIQALSESDGNGVADEFPPLDFWTVVERLRPFWSDDQGEAEYVSLVARTIVRRRRRSKKRGAHLVGRRIATPGTGAKPGNSNAMRNGKHSAPLAPLMGTLGRKSRLVVQRAIARALDDALAAATFHFVHHRRIEASVRVWARDFAWRKVITLLHDAEWYPADIVDPLPDALTAARRRRARDAAVAAELERILAPVFTGTVREALVVPLPSDSAR
jgi:hypothetical protein